MTLRLSFMRGCLYWLLPVGLEKSFFLMNIIITWISNCTEVARQWNSKLAMKYGLYSDVTAYTLRFKPFETDMWPQVSDSNNSVSEYSINTRLTCPSDKLLLEGKAFYINLMGFVTGFLKVNNTGWKRPGILRPTAVWTVYKNCYTTDPLHPW